MLAWDESTRTNFGSGGEAMVAGADDNSRSALSWQSVDVAGQIKLAVTQSATKARAQGHEVAVHCDETVGTMDGDAPRLTQMVAKLLDNALVYTPGTGTVSVTAHGTADYVYVTVSDTGVGIAVGEQASVFERFARGSNSRAIAGAGLGLSLVKHYAELHGGTVALTSAVGSGTSVEISLPRQRSAERKVVAA